MRMSMKNPRRIAAIASSMALAIGLAACGIEQNGGSDPAPGGTTTGGGLGDEQIELRVTWWGGDARHERTQQAIDAFQDEYPNITVVGEFSDWSGYWDRLATATAGGSSPDVIQMDELYLASYADRDSLADLEALTELDASSLDPAVVDLGRSQGTLYGMPISTTAFGLLVNEDLLADLGLELPDDTTWTWEEFDEFALQISETGSGDIVGTAPLSNGYSLQLWARQNGEALFTDGDVSVSAGTLAGYFQHAVDLTQSGAAASASRQAELAGASLDQTDFATGRQGLAFSQITQISAYAAAANDANLSARLIPTIDGDQGYSYLKPGMYWAISSQSETPEAAAAFIDFMVNSEEAGAILGTERGIPANAHVRDAIADSLTENETKAADFVALVEENLGEAPEITPNGASELDNLIIRYLQEVLFESQTPEAAAEAFIGELQSSIDSAS